MVDSSSGDNTHVISSSDRQLVIHLTQVLVAMATDRKRMRRRVFPAGEAVVAVGDGGDSRPHVSAEKVHVLDVLGSIARHYCTETVSDIISVINYYHHNHNRFPGTNSFSFIICSSIPWLLFTSELSGKIDAFLR